MKRSDKELILKLADIYCRMADSPKGTPTSFTNLLKSGIDLDALMQTLDMSPVSEDKETKIRELSGKIEASVSNREYGEARTAVSDLVNFVSENVPVEQLSPAFAAFMGAPMTPEGDALSNTSRAMMTALNKSDPDEQDIEAINRGADLLSGLVRDNKIAGGFSDLLEGMPMPEPEPEMG